MSILLAKAFELCSVSENTFLEFIREWQTLLGSALGATLAVLGSIFLYWIKIIHEKSNLRKECLRRVEIGITRSLEDTYKMQKKLHNFVERLRSLISAIRSITDSRHFSMESINFPTTREIYKDVDAPNFITSSYYLHNKLLWADAGIKETNETIVSLKNDFTEIQRKNELQVFLTRQNQIPNAEQQRNDYAASLESFANTIEEFINSFMKQGIKNLMQIKIYNNHLRGREGKSFLKKNEGKNFQKTVDSLDGIDSAIEAEVQSEITRIEARMIGT